MSDLVDQYLGAVLKAKTSEGGNHIRDGVYTFMVDRMTLKPARSPSRAVYFIAEFVVVASSPTDVDGKPSNPNLPGSTCSFMTDLTTDSGPGNMKAFFLALAGKKDGEMADAELDGLIRKSLGEANPARGLLIRDETRRTTIKKGPNAGKPFIANKWVHVEDNAGNDEASVAARLAGAPKAS